MTGNSKLADCGASFIRYWLEYEEGKMIENNFPCSANEKTFKHDFKTANLTAMLQGLKEKRIEFTLNKKKCCGA